MIPKLFASTATRFTSNGLGRLSDAVECTVTEERNGPYELFMRYPITGKHYADIQISRIIYAVPADGKAGQPFRIYRIEKPLNGIVSIYAEHISYQLNHIPVMPFTATSCAAALTQMVSHSAQANPFTVWTDKSVAGNFTLAEPRAFRALLGGTQGSILDVYGKGEYEFDNYIVKLHLNRGIDTGVVLRYGKNITDLTQDENIEATITGVCPFWRDQTSGETVTLPEYAVWSSTAANFPYKRTAVVDFTTDFQEEPTVEQLRARANQYIEDNDIGIPKVSLDVQFVPLWQMEGVSTGNPTRTLMLPATVDGDTLQNLGGSVSGDTVTLSDAYWDITFDDYKVLERLHLCDTLTVRYDALGVDATAKIVKTVYNVLTDRYDSLEVGDARTNLAAQIAGVDDSLERLRTQMQNERSTLQAYVDHQTELITGGLGGYVVFKQNADGQPEEILIMDSDDMTTAVNVIRMNQNGIGFSRTGYNGPFTSAWTIDGTFNADFIGAGSITANIIKGGLLTDEAGRNYWNLVSGDLSMSGEFAMAANNMTANIGEISYITVNSDGSTTTHTTNGFKVSPTDGDTYNSLTADGKTIVKISSNISRNGSYPQKNVVFTSTSSGGGSWVHCVTEGAFYERHTRKAAEDVGYKLLYDQNAIGYSATTGSWTHTENTIEWPADPGGTGGWQVPDRAQPNFVISANRIAVNKNYTTGYQQTYVPSIWIDSTYQKINGKTISFASSSSERFKHDIAPLDDDRDPHKLLDLEPKQFVYNEGHLLQYADMDGQTLPGFIAEDVERVYPSAVIRDPEGNVESWDERRIIPGMLALIQEQQKRIEKLEKMIERMMDSGK